MLIRALNMLKGLQTYILLLRGGAAEALRSLRRQRFQCFGWSEAE